jgi:uncharacterized SAM-binding protein YcdF (DUF218 family)
VKKRGFLICALVFSISVITLGAIFFLNAPQYLSSPASEPRNSDVILILGGDDDVRIIRGLELYKQGFAKKVILPCYLNRPIAAAEFNSNKFVRMFISAGAGKQDIYFEPVSKNTWEEGVNTLPLMKEHGWQSVIIVSDPPHMRRIQWVWNKVTKDTPTRLWRQALNGGFPAKRLGGGRTGRRPRLLNWNT